MQPAEEMDEDEPLEEESRDELYVMLKTSIVGVQYYHGTISTVVALLLANPGHLGLVAPGEEVLLVREPRNRYDRYVLRRVSVPKS